MRIAVEGCAHGELEIIYESIAYIENREKYKIDLLICCGDFQATRNLNDLECMAVPRKFAKICTFYKYYSGEEVAPVLTIFIGGNHEASNYLQELPYGGWVAPNIYYLGYAGVINVNGLRIGGVSGIFKGGDFFRGRHEFSPYTESTKRSVYHLRQLDVFRLKQMSSNFDIFLSHDWPKGVYNYGNAAKLIKNKPFFKSEIENNELGSAPAEELLNTLQPKYWFAAHLHCAFSAIIPHEHTKTETKFLALDKCLPHRQFLQILDIGDSKESDTNIELEYDLEWLTILNLTNHLISVKNTPNYMPGKGSEERWNFAPTQVEKEKIFKLFDKNLKIPLNFVKTADFYNPEYEYSYRAQPKSFINPQTTMFCEKLGIDDPLCLAMLISGEELNHSTLSEEISLNDDDFIDSDCSGDNSLENNTLTGIDLLPDISPIKFPQTPLSLPKPKTIDDGQYSISNEKTSDDDDSIIENFDNKWIEDRAPQNTSNDKNEKEVANSSLNEMNSVLLNSTDPPIKKFKRRNESIYNNLEE